MLVSSKRVIISVIITVVLLVGVGVRYLVRIPQIPDRSVLNDKPQLFGYYDRAVQYEEKVRQNPSLIENYIVVGSEWKLIGDATKNSIWYRLALDVYERGNEVAQHKNSLLLSNAGAIAQELGNYNLAKKYYLQAIDLAPGDASYHLTYIHLLRYKFKVSEFDLLRAYDEAMKRVIGGADLVSSRMSYLKAVGRYDDARDDLELLYKNKLLSNEQYKSELNELEQLQSAKQ